MFVSSTFLPKREFTRLNMIDSHFKIFWMLTLSFEVVPCSLGYGYCVALMYNITPCHHLYNHSRLYCLNLNSHQAGLLPMYAYNLVLLCWIVVLPSSSLINCFWCLFTIYHVGKFQKWKRNDTEKSARSEKRPPFTLWNLLTLDKKIEQSLQAVEQLFVTTHRPNEVENIYLLSPDKGIKYADSIVAWLQRKEKLLPKVKPKHLVLSEEKSIFPKSVLPASYFAPSPLILADDEQHTSDSQ
jgi:hypothetical protein